MTNKKKLMVVFTIILSMILVSKVLGAEITTFAPKYGITTSNVNLRAATNTSSTVFTTVKKNTYVKIIGELNDFYAVQLSSNQIGFLSKKYISLTSKRTIGLTFYSLTPANYETTTNLIVRKGPSSNFGKITTLKKGIIVTVFGKINDFYAVIYDTNKIGMMSINYLTKSYAKQENNPNNLSNRDLVIYYINEERKKANLNTLKDTTDLNRVALLKSEDMVKNNYFLHTSPTYGTPFNMLKNYGITYNYAGENIAGNTSMKKAVEKWMQSDSHKRNILSSKYKYIGVGVTKSDKYGYIIVTMFTG